MLEWGNTMKVDTAKRNTYLLKQDNDFMCSVVTHKLLSS